MINVLPTYHPLSMYFVVNCDICFCPVPGTVPIYTVEKQSFLDLIGVLDNRYSVPGRNVFTRSAIPKLYAETKDRVKRHLKDASGYETLLVREE